MAEFKRPPGVKIYSWPPGVGYGDASKEYILGLAEAGVPVTWTPMVSSTAWAEHGLWSAPAAARHWGRDPDLAPYANQEIPYDRVVIHLVPEFFPYVAALEQGKIIIGMTVWETDRLPESWPKLLNSCDRICVPTDWNRRVFQQNGVTCPIHVVPHSLPPDFSFRTDQAPALDLEVRTDDFVFYTIGTWTARKDMDATLDAYFAAFSAQDPTVLVVKTTQRDLSRRQPWLDGLQRLLAITLRLLGLINLSLGMVAALEPLRSTSREALQRIARGFKSPPRVILITEEWPRQKIEALHRRGDCFLSLCHAEGWGLSAFEAAGQGTPVVITGFGGQTEFLPDKLANLVDYDLVPVDDPSGGRSYTTEQRWGQARVKHGAEILRDILGRQSFHRQKALKLSHYIQKNFNRRRVTQHLMTALTREDSG